MKAHPRPRYVATLLLGALLFSSEAAAQTALLDTPLFQLNDDGGLVSLSTFGTGVIPVSGAGARLMWHPKKAAFRAGLVQGSQWDEAHVGDYSVALGWNTMASGEISTALGNLTVASGLNAVAMGAVTTASGENATAIGFGTEASNDYTTAIGRYATASGQYATAMGQNTTASAYASMALGTHTTASSDYATAMGSYTTASGGGSTAMGAGTTASGNSSTAMGAVTTASGNSSTAMGNETTAKAYASLALGQYNTIAGNSTFWVAGDPVLVVGNGTSSSSSNAFTLLKNGNLTIAGSLTQNSDRRLKTDIQPLADAVSGLARLQAVRFRFREGMNRSEGAHIGLIAQEVQAVFPALVSAGSDGYLSVSYTNLVAVLVQGLNEQQTEIAAQQARMEAQQAQIEAQQNEIDTLKAQQAGIEALRAEVAALRNTVETRPPPPTVAER